MRIEGGDSQRDHVLDIIRNNFSRGCKLDRQARNMMGAIQYAFSGQDTGGNPRRFLRNYEEYLRSTYNEDQADLAMQLSNPEAIAAFDSIMNELRQNFDTITASGAEAVEEYCSRLLELIEGK
ncbi:MAG: hypothetical protein WC777_03430 [Candidatus Gracilibacteria bacterium]|jgi:hypothetical protein